MPSKTRGQNMKPVIHVKNLKKTFKTHRRGEGLLNAVKSLFKREFEIKKALKGVSFNIGKGEVVGFIGPNGAGKSTCIKALAGVLHPTSGVVNVLGYVPWKERVAYVKNIGVVFGQKSQLWWDLPAIDTFYLHKEIYEIPEKEFKEKLDYMIDLMKLKDIVKVPVRDLSLGERMKCQLVAALLHNPKIVFLDEPTIGLDVIAKNTLREFIKYTNEKYGTTFIVTTHDMSDIERLCKRVIIINYGKILYDGPLKKIKTKYLKKKDVYVKFEEPFEEEIKMQGCKLVGRKRSSIKLEVDTSKQPIKQLIQYLIKNFEIADIIVMEPAIEEIIQEIYKEKK